MTLETDRSSFQGPMTLETDCTGKLDACSPLMCKWLGFNTEELLGRELMTRLIPDGMCTEALQSALHCALSGKDTSGLKVALVCKDTRVEPVVVDVQPRKDGKGDIGGVVLQLKIDNAANVLPEEAEHLLHGQSSYPRAYLVECSVSSSRGCTEHTQVRFLFGVAYVEY